MVRHTGNGVINTVIRAERDFLVAAIDRAAAGIYQVLDRVVSASFEDVVESDNVALDVSIRILDAITDSDLGGKVDDDGRLYSSKIGR